jgi:hypothetical protein
MSKRTESRPSEAQTEPPTTCLDRLDGVLAVASKKGSALQVGHARAGMVRAGRSARLWLCLLCLQSCAGVNEMEKKEQRSEEDFRKAKYPTYEESPCSPEVTEEFRGLLIRVPAKARFPAAGPVALEPDAPWLPVCGVIQLPSEDLDNLGVDAILGVVLVFVDRATGVPLSFNLVPDKPRAPPDRTRRSDIVVLDSVPEDQIVRNAVFTQHFNIDAFMLRRDFPRRTARYRVHALLGKYKSNVVEVDVEAD